jgi:hypothetical protein
MKRMNSDEIREVITTRIKRLRMRIADDAVWRVTYFSAGLSFYAHSLGKYSALTAIENRKLEIREETVISSIDRCKADVDYTSLYAGNGKDLQERQYLCASCRRLCSR